MAEVLISCADLPSPPPTLPFPRKLTPGSPVSLCLSLRAVTGDVWVPSDVLGVQGEAGDPGESRARSSQSGTAYWHSRLMAML